MKTRQDKQIAERFERKPVIPAEWAECGRCGVIEWRRERPECYPAQISRAGHQSHSTLSIAIVFLVRFSLRLKIESAVVGHCVRWKCQLKRDSSKVRPYKQNWRKRSLARSLCSPTCHRRRAARLTMRKDEGSLPIRWCRACAGAGRSNWLSVRPSVRPTNTVRNAQRLPRPGGHSTLIDNLSAINVCTPTPPVSL